MPLSHSLVRKADNLELPLLGLRAICQLRSELDDLQTEHIRAARSKGASWTDIADALHVSRQALQQKMRVAETKEAAREITISLEEADPAITA